MRVWPPRLILMNWTKRSEPASRSFRSMGGLAAVTLGASSSRRIDSIAEQIENLYEQLERELSAFRLTSAITLLEEKAAVAPVAISDDAFRVLTLGKQFGDFSDGTFDITMAPLARIWGFGRAQEPTETPSEDEIQDQLKL